MTTADTDSTPTYAELEQRVLDGDTTITAQDLAEAAQTEKLAALQAQAAQRAQQATDARERAAAIEALQAEFDKLRGTGSVPARKAYAKVVTALAELAAEVTTLTEGYADLRNQASLLEVTLPFWDDRVIEGSIDEFVTYADREARGEWLGGRNTPHALHTDAQVVEHREHARKVAEAQAEREAKAAENYETVVEHGFGNYTRRIEV